MSRCPGRRIRLPAAAAGVLALGLLWGCGSDDDYRLERFRHLVLKSQPEEAWSIYRNLPPGHARAIQDLSLAGHAWLLRLGAEGARIFDGLQDAKDNPAHLLHALLDVVESLPELLRTDLTHLVGKLGRPGATARSKFELAFLDLMAALGEIHRDIRSPGAVAWHANRVSDAAARHLVASLEHLSLAEGTPWVPVPPEHLQQCRAWAADALADIRSVSGELRVRVGVYLARMLARRGSS